MMISQGVAAYFMNHYIKIGESSVIESLRGLSELPLRCLVENT
jgi:hypothetical protein